MAVIAVNVPYTWGLLRGWNKARCSIGGSTDFSEKASPNSSRRDSRTSLLRAPRNSLSFATSRKGGASSKVWSRDHSIQRFPGEVTQIHANAHSSCAIQHPPSCAEGPIRTRHSVSAAAADKLYKLDSLDNSYEQMHQKGAEGTALGPHERLQSCAPGTAEIGMLYDPKQSGDEDNGHCKAYGVTLRNTK